METYEGEAEFKKHWNAHHDELLEKETEEVEGRIRKKIRLKGTKEVDRMLTEELASLEHPPSPQQDCAPSGSSQQVKRRTVNILGTIFKDGKELHEKYISNEPLS